MSKVVLNESKSNFSKINTPQPTIRTRQNAMYDKCEFITIINLGFIEETSRLCNEINLEFNMTTPLLCDTLSDEYAICVGTPDAINSNVGTTTSTNVDVD
jgi:hypothetical protein